MVGLQKIFITIIEQVEENHAVGRHISLLSLNNTAKNIIWLKFLNFHPWKWPRFFEFQEIIIANKSSKSGPKDPNMSLL